MRFVLFVKSVLLGLFVLSIAATLSPAPKEQTQINLGHAWEEYEPSYFSRFQSIHDVIIDADRHFPGQSHSLGYYNYVAGIIRKRFYHGYSYYSFHDNPLCYLSSYLFKDLRAIVIPDDIMKHPMAACSQQSLVLVEIFKRLGIPYREVGYNHHFTVEGWIDGDWRYFDPDLEPDFGTNRVSLHELINQNRFSSVYHQVTSRNQGRLNFDHPFYGGVNAALAWHASFFQHATLLLSWKWLLVILYLVVVFFSEKVRHTRFSDQPAF